MGSLGQRQSPPCLAGCARPLTGLLHLSPTDTYQGQWCSWRLYQAYEWPYTPATDRNQVWQCIKTETIMSCWLCQASDWPHTPATDRHQGCQCFCWQCLAFGWPCRTVTDRHQVGHASRLDSALRQSPPCLAGCAWPLAGLVHLPQTDTMVRACKELH